jgi:hypothetical protein
MAYLFLKDRTGDAYIFSVLVCLLPLVFASFVRREYAPRYVFHMYPLLVIVFAFAVCELGAAILERIATLLRLQNAVPTLVEAFTVAFLAIILSQDIYPSKALAISTRTYTSAKEPPIKASLNWEPTHDDYRTPGLFVKASMKPADIIVVLGPPHVPSIFYHYIGRVDYIGMTAEDMSPWIGGTGLEDYGLYTDKGVVHYTTGAIILREPPTVENLLIRAGTGRVWILAERYPDAYHTITRLHPRHEFTGQDGRTSVYIIDPPRADPETSRRPCLSRNKSLLQ